MITISRLKNLFVAWGWFFAAVFVYYHFYEERQLDTAPVALARVQHFGKHQGKNTSCFARVAFQPTGSTSGPVITEVPVDTRLYDRRHLYDTLAIRYSPSHPETAAYLASDTSIVWPTTMLGFGLFTLVSLYWPAHWLPRLQSWRWFRLSWHGSLALLGAVTLTVGLQGCIEWSGRDGRLGPYYQGPHVLGRVVAASTLGTPSSVQVSFRPTNESAPFEARLRLLPLPTVYHYTFTQALALGWQPQVEVWYPKHHQEQAQLLIQLQPAATEKQGSSNGFLTLIGFVLLTAQIKSLEQLRMQKNT